MMIKTSFVEGLPSLAGYFEDLPRDNYRPDMRRGRRFAQYICGPDGFTRLPHKPYRKGQTEREIAPLPEEIDHEAVYQEMLRDFAASFDVADDQDAVFDVHAIRVVARRGVHGFPTTQFHRDNAVGVAVYCVAREGIRGATTVLRRTVVQPDEHRAELQPGEALLWDDRELVHYTTPIRGDGHRDVFVVTFRREVPSFNRLYGLFLRTSPLTHLVGKMAMREAAQRCGLRVPELIAGPAQITQLQEPREREQIVIKPLSGCMSAGVLPLVRRGSEWRNPWLDDARPWERWQAYASARWPGLTYAQWIIEEMIGSGAPPYDWKFHCVHGRVQIVSQFRRNGQTRWAKVWSREFEPLGDVLPDRVRSSTRRDDESMPPPRFATELVEAAEDLSRYLGLEFVRVDLYEDERGPVFGEITQRPINVRFVEWLDRKMGRAWLSGQRQ